LGNGIIHITDQNIRGLPGRMSDSGATDDRYTYDPNANVSAIRDHQNWFDHRSMGYDQLDRLVSFATDWGASTYTYDPLDNIRTSSVAGRYLNHNIDPATNRLSSLSGSQSISMQYDANGNLTQRAGNGYRFDIGNRMTEAVGKASRYVYDAEGRRSFIYYADGNVGASAYSQDGKVMFTGGRYGTNYFIHLGGKQIAQHHVTNGTGTPTIRYIHTDGLGSPMLRSDANGNLISGSRTRYEPYGRIIENGVPEGLELGYTGHINDTETGLTYMQQRYYEPLAGRFLSVDPVTTDAKEGGHFNRYNYAYNNPYKFKDPDGKAGVAFTVGGDLTLGRGATAGAGGYFALDTRTAGALTFTGDTYGLSTGFNASATFFAGSGTSLLEGKATNFNISALALSLGVTFSSNSKDGFLGITAITVGVGAGLPVGATASTTNTVIQSKAQFAPPPSSSQSGTPQSATTSAIAPSTSNQGSSGGTGFQGVFQVSGRIESADLAKKLDK
jgi:RHS repeat-associated protein